MAALTVREKCAHLLRRFALGASVTELDYYSQGGLQACIDNLLSSDTAKEPVELSVDALTNDKGVLNMPQVVVWWSAKILMTHRPLHYKMSVFWHNHFATSGEKVKAPPLMAQHVETLEQHATGNFKDLLLGISRDPAMLIWLDNTENIKGHANENFAREVMELFTLGIGNYSETDVQEGARAFTGWSYTRTGGKSIKDRFSAEFQYKEKLHDDGEKTFLGRTGFLTGEDVLQHLCSKPKTAEYITWKIWNWFVYQNPKPEVIAPFAKKFYDSGYDIKTLLRAIMTSEEFYSPRAVGQLIKNPVDVCITTLRQLGIGEALATKVSEASDSDTNSRAKFAVAAAAVQSMKNQGMWLLFPPDVSGWKPGDSWITSATLIERIAWAGRLFGNTGKGKVTRQMTMYPLLARDTSPEGVARQLCSIFDVHYTDQKMGTLANTAAKAMGSGLTPKNANQVSFEVARLIFGSPEFQVC